MKSLKLIATLALVALLTACGGTKDANYKGQKLIEKSRSQQMAEQKPTLRVWAEASHSDLSLAKKYAALKARDDYAQTLAGEINSVLNLGDITDSKGTANDKKSSHVIDHQGIMQLDINGKAHTVANGLFIINTDTYQQKNNEYHVFVCMESNPKALAQALDQIESTIDKNQQISNSDKKEYKQRIQDLRNKIKRDEMK